MPSVSPIWLSHHEPSEYSRCVRVGEAHLCRRCLLLWPLTFAVLALAGAGVRWGRSLDPYLLVALPAPAVAEFVLEHLGYVRYRPVLQAVVTAPLACALGVGFDRYLGRQGDPLFWGVVVGYGAVSFGSVVLGARRG